MAESCKGSSCSCWVRGVGKRSGGVKSAAVAAGAGFGCVTPGCAGSCGKRCRAASVGASSPSSDR